ncbi:MAG TPA: T9SS type A sorting domain-containing protein [Flavisolibacter sp.]|nr:T9SS type A sorting domain-containing protein [Flavisolibacter sp.]
MKRFLLIASLFLLFNARSEAQDKGSQALNTSVQAPILRFYPNPATTVITFDFQKTYEKGYSIQIYSFLGRKMVEQSNISNQTTINLTDFTRGVYVYKLFDKSGKLVETGKFQVSK